MNFQVNLNICRVCMKAEQGQTLTENADLLNKFKFATQLELNPLDNMPKNICTRCVVRLKVSSDFIELAQASEVTLRAFLEKINIDFQTVTQSSADDGTLVYETEEEKSAHDEDMLEYLKNADTAPPSPPAATTTKSSSALKPPQGKSLLHHGRIKRQRSATPSPPPQLSSVPEEQEVTEVSAYGIFKPNGTEQYAYDEQGGAVYIANMTDGEPEEVNCEIVALKQEQTVIPMESDGDYLKEFVVLLEDSEQVEHMEPVEQCDSKVDIEEAKVQEPQVYESIEETPVDPPDNFECIIEADETILASTSNIVKTQLPASNIRVIRKRQPQDLSNTSFYCVQCKRDFSTRTNLTRHLMSHDGTRPYECNICHKGFTQNGTLKQHMYTHTGEKPYVCKYCNRGFTQCKSLVFHMRRHTGEKPFHCERCGLSFRQKDALRNHVLKFHTITKQQGDAELHICVMCKKGHATQAELLTHLKQHLNSGTPATISSAVSSTADVNELIDESRLLNAKALVEEEELAEDGVDAELTLNLDATASAVLDITRTSTDVVSRAKKFQCRKCFKCFAIKRNLLRHLSIHSESILELLQCSICDVVFSDKEALRTHQRSEHRDQDEVFDEVFQCDGCQLTAATQQEMEAHAETCTAAFFTCPVCPDVHFDARKLYVEHMLEHELEEDEDDVAAMSSDEGNT